MVSSDGFLNVVVVVVVVLFKVRTCEGVHNSDGSVPPSTINDELAVWRHGRANALVQVTQTRNLSPVTQRGEDVWRDKNASTHSCQRRRSAPPLTMV